MTDAAGQLSGHLSQTPLAFTWAQLIEHFIAERGSLAELARHLQDVAPPGLALSPDPQTVERGLRRLRAHGNQPANKYGRLLLRCLGLPGSVTTWARELGCYHSRSSDLPMSLRVEQLRLWDRPPVSEAPAVAVWVHIALAGLALRGGDRAQLTHRIGLARLTRAHAPAEARVELALLEARVHADAGATRAAEAELEAAHAVLETLRGDAHTDYAARWWDQRAYLDSRGWRVEPERLERALEHYAAIEPETCFAEFRREHGRAWCLWRQGHKDAARESARRAARAAGDAGTLRFRAMAVALEAHIDGLHSAAGRALLDRARAMARRIEDPLLEAQWGTRDDVTPCVKSSEK